MVAKTGKANRRQNLAIIFQSDPKVEWLIRQHQATTADMTTSIHPLPGLVPHIQRLNVPDTISILSNDTVSREEAHSGHTSDGLRNPLILIQECLVNHLLCADIGAEIIRDKVVIPVVSNRRYKS